MAFPTTNLQHLQPSCMGVQYHTSPQEYTSLSTHKNTLDVQCYTSPQDSLSTYNNYLLEYYISSGLLQDHEQMLVEGYSTLAEWVAQNQLMNSNDVGRSNIDWLNQASNYDYKDSQDPLINSSSTISSTNQASKYEYEDAKETLIPTISSTNQASNYGYKEPFINSSATISSTNLSPKPHIDQFSNYNFGKQALANYINDAPPLILSNNKPLEIEPKALDLQVLEQELALCHNVGASINVEMPYNLKCVAQGEEILNASSFNLLCDGAPSLGIAEESNMMNAASSLCRSTITDSCNAHNFFSHNEERGNAAVVKREEREYGDGYSSMMLNNSNTHIHCGGARRESEKKRCREEGAPCTSGEGKRENKSIGEERETRREKSYRRENVGRKRCKRRTAAAGGGHSEEEEEEQDVILVRARRGQATDSHSLAERVRRERISQRMKLLQDLVPSCTKVLGKAAVLEEIINYVKSLQQQIEFLSMRLATTDYQKRFQI